jgi:thioredoxin-related protein
MPGCPHCEKMIEETYHLPNVEQFVSESFESVHVSSKTQPTLVKSLKVKWFPTTVLVGPNNKIVDVIEGFVDAKTFERRLQTGLASADSSTQTR